MLIDSQVFVKWSRQNKEWYVNKGYNFTQYGDVFMCKVDDLPKYSKTPIKIKCDYCNEIIETTWASRCRNEHKTDAYVHCRQKRTSENTLKERRLKLYNKALDFCSSNGYELLTNIEEISTSSSIVYYLCPKHGVFETKIYALVLHHGCKMCQYENNAKKSRLNVDDVEKMFNKYGGKLLNKEDYTGWSDKNLKAQSPKCGKLFITSFYAFIKNHGQICEECSKTISVGESKIKTYLENHNIEYISQKRFIDCKDTNTLPFDFYLPHYNMCIEYNGRQHYEAIDYFGGEKHYESQIKHDKIKANYCLNNKINLLIIPYWDIDNIEYILNKELILHNNIV